MQYTLLTNTFGGLNYKADPAVIGPAGAQENSGVEVAAGVAVPAAQVSTTTLAYSVTSCGTLGASQVLATNDSTRADYDFGNPYTYSEYAGRCIRIPRYPASASVSTDWVPQYTTSAGTPVWQALGIKAPLVGSFAGASGAAGNPNGTYRAVVVFYNAFGDESPPTASVQIVVTSDKIDYSGLPIGYGSGTTTNGNTTITSVANPSRFRPGMRITAPSGITAGTYVTNVDVGAATIDISKPATASGARELQDAQATGRRIYRTTADGTTYYRAVDIDNVTATTYTGDDTSDAALEVLSILSTDADDDVLPAIYGAAVSPDGVLMGIKEGEPTSLVFTNDVGNMLWKADQELDVPAQASQLAYALSRFCVFTNREICFVLGASRDDFDVIKTSAVAPVYNGTGFWGGLNPVEMPDGSLWFTSTQGVARFDGSGVDFLTRDIFTPAQNDALWRYAFAAAVDQGRYILLTSITTFSAVRALLYDPEINGWRWLTNDDAAISSGSRGAIWVDTASFPKATYYYLNTTQLTLAPDAGPDTSGVYWTGEWSGERRSSLKKFRRVSVMHNGNLTVQPYVDGAVAGSAQVLTRSTLGRSVFWLPSGTKGRTCSVKLTLSNASAEVHEIGVWVGEERGPMP